MEGAAAGFLAEASAFRAAYSARPLQRRLEEAAAETAAAEERHHAAELRREKEAEERRGREHEIAGGQLLLPAPPPPPSQILHCTEPCVCLHANAHAHTRASMAFEESVGPAKCCSQNHDWVSIVQS